MNCVPSLVYISYNCLSSAIKSCSSDDITLQIAPSPHSIGDAKQYSILHHTAVVMLSSTVFLTTQQW